MTIAPGVRDVFGHFQNLNLLALLEDLRGGRIARHAWHWGERLCPVAHGLPAGRHVRDLKALGQEAGLERGCDYAARRLGAHPEAVLRFVRGWDEETFGAGWLLHQLELLWRERLEDAIVMQSILQPVRDRESV